MPEGVLDARVEEFSDLLHSLLAEIAPDRVHPEPEREACPRVPPGSKIEIIDQSVILICQLSLVDEEAGTVASFHHGAEDLVKWEDGMRELADADLLPGTHGGA